MQIIGQKKFAAVALDMSEKAFVVHMAYLKATMSIYPAWKVQVALLVNEKVIIPVKYLDSVDMFLKNLATKLFE